MEPRPQARPTETDPRLSRGTPAFRRALAALFAAGFATFALLYAVQPLLPTLATGFKVSATAASLSLSLTTAVLAGALLFAGAAAEHFRRRTLLVASLLSACGLTMWSSASESWGLFLASRALLGLALSGVPVSAMAYLAEEMHPRSLGLAMGLYVSGTGLGGLAGRLMAGAVTDASGWRAALALTGLVGIVCAALVWSVLPPSRHVVPRGSRPAGPGDYRRLMCSGALPWLAALGFVVMGSFVTVFNYIGFRLMASPYDLTQTQVASLSGVYVFGIAAASLTGPLATWLTPPRLLTAALLTMLTGTLITMGAALWMVLTGLALLATGFFVAHSTLSAWVSAEGTASRAQAAALYLCAYYLGASIVGSLGGHVWTADGWRGVTTLTAILLTAALIVARRLGASDSARFVATVPSTDRPPTFTGAPKPQEQPC